MPRSSSPVRTPGSHPGNHGFESHTRYHEINKKNTSFPRVCFVFLYNHVWDEKGIPKNLTASSFWKPRLWRRYFSCVGRHVKNNGGRGIPYAIIPSRWDSNR